MASLVYSSFPAIAILPIDNLKLNNVVPLGINFTFDLLTASSVIFSFVSFMTCPFISAMDTHKLSPLKNSPLFLDGVPPIKTWHTSPNGLTSNLLSI